ncbi:hypothetical protein C8Q79DRAFT_1012817 [Trametes meyenii]|nr:hypothetical protein C8Q79DRAFT_1012817 [Trametes meyenii]
MSSTVSSELLSDAGSLTANDYCLMSAAVAVLARLPLILADLAVVLITWSTQYATYEHGLVLGTRTDLTTVLLRNGTVYFIILTTLNFLQMILTIFSVPAAENQTNTNIITTFIEPLTAILISSFLTDLNNAANSSSYDEDSRSTVIMSSVQFNAMDSLGLALPAPGESTVRNSWVSSDESRTAGNDER